MTAKTGKLLLRLALYLGGFFVFSFGTALSIKSTLGVTAVTSMPMSLSTVTGLSVGAVIAAMAVLYVVGQALLLRRGFKPINVLQVGIGLWMGFWVDMFCDALAFFAPATYLQKLLLLLAGLPLIALGLSLIINARFLPSPSEGFSLALSEKIGLSFPKTKVLTDCITLVIAVLLPLLFSKQIVGIREGTLVNAVSVGFLIGLFTRLLKPLYTLANGPAPAADKAPAGKAA